MTQKRNRKRAKPEQHMADAETVAEELGKAESMDDFFDEEDIFARLVLAWIRPSRVVRYGGDAAGDDQREPFTCLQTLTLGPHGANEQK